MPELPEVETIARGLAEEVVGWRVAHVDVAHPTQASTTQEQMDARVRGGTVSCVWRRGKLLVADVTQPTKQPDGCIVHLAVHLRMTGRFWLPGSCNHCAPPGKHDHIRFVLERDGMTKELWFSDVRTFGSCRPLTPNELTADPFFASLGPEPLELDAKAFTQLFAARPRRTAIKALLLDQKFIAGLGNIYVDEGLFGARIRPDTPAHKLTKPRLVRLHASLTDVLTRAIAENGSSFSDYRDARGNAGAFQNSFAVYGRKGEPCNACGTSLRGATIGGRSTVYCPRCQKA